MSEVALMRLKEIFNKSKSAKPKLIKYIDFIDNSSVINITKINHINISRSHLLYVYEEFKKRLLSFINSCEYLIFTLLILLKLFLNKI